MTLAAGGIYAGYGVAIQADGKIVIAGSKQTGSSSTDIALFRVLNNGSVDNTFGNNGIVTTDLGESGIARAIVIQPDSKIVVAGTAGSELAIARYLPGTVVDTEEPDAAPTFSIQPNPASDFIEIETSGDVGVAARISLYDSGSRLLRSANFENRLRWDTGSLTPGVYWIQLQTSGSSHMEKLIIQH